MCKHCSAAALQQKVPDPSKGPQVLAYLKPISRAQLVAREQAREREHFNILSISGPWSSLESQGVMQISRLDSGAVII